ncbi:unnamed protein product [Symbiodinium natans]|uniref:DUF547 domain-containing protein n=1 Tax=Symbiodinium natans TaxID=878477 RepID=A0A812JGL9_9DINO|nr:unnamed protein product [Symbiodinium natans]
MMCKTQITDLYMDNDELSARRQEELLEEAAQLLSRSEGAVDVAEANLHAVCAFLKDASMRQSPEEQGPLKTILRHLQRDATWAATRLLSALGGDAARAQRAARRIQGAWKRSRTRVAEEPVSPLGLGRKKALGPGRSVRDSRSCGRTSWRWSRCERVSCVLPGATARTAEALSIHLLREGSELLAQLPGMPAMDVVTQFQRNCLALDSALVPMKGAAAVAFWLNVRNLVVVLALLQQASRPAGRLPSSSEEWRACLSCTSLFVMGRPLSAQDIDHHVLGLGSHSPLSFPSRKSLQSLCGEQGSVAGHVQGLMPWPIFGLWLPVSFGLPALRAFESEILLAQLRSSAESLVDRCRCVAEAPQEAGYPRSNTLRLPPILRLSCAVWQPLLKCRGSLALSTELCDIDWTFVPTGTKIQTSDA